MAEDMLTSEAASAQGSFRVDAKSLRDGFVASSQ